MKRRCILPAILLALASSALLPAAPPAAAQARLETKVDKLTADVSELRGEVGEIRGEVGELRTEVAVLRKDQARFEASVEKRLDRLETVVVDLRKNQTRLEVTMADMKAELTLLFVMGLGTNLAAMAVGIAFLAWRESRRARQQNAATPQPSPELVAAVAEALATRAPTPSYAYEAKPAASSAAGVREPPPPPYKPPTP